MTPLTSPNNNNNTQNPIGSKHIKGSKERYLLEQNTSCDFRDNPVLSSYKTTLEQQLNGAKR